MLEDIDIESRSAQPGASEGIDLFRLLEQWDQTETDLGSYIKTPFGSAPAQHPYVGAPEPHLSFARKCAYFRPSPRNPPGPT